VTGLLSRLKAVADAGRAGEMAAYHKAERGYLGIGNPVINELAAEARKALRTEERLIEATALWSSDIHEARILAAKLFEQRRIRPDDAVWTLICNWVPDFDAWAIADHVCKAGSFRLAAKPERLAMVEGWTRHPSFWVRRAALVMTLPWARLKAPDTADLARRERILGWAATYAADPAWFIQKCVSWWLRELSAQDPARVVAFVARHRDVMAAFAVKDSLRNLG
jgi:3-methyladenine DNA glycosylase AlkD